MSTILRRRRAGFSLLEAVVTVSIIGAVAAVVVPKFTDSLQKHRATQAAIRIAADLSLARSSANSTSAPKTVTFIVGTSEYSIAGMNSPDKPSAPYRIVLSVDPYRSTLVSVFGQTGTQSITFDGYGLSNKGGEVVVAAGKTQKVIVVDALSGAAVVQ